jgi:hypothetical protein
MSKLKEIKHILDTCDVRRPSVAMRLIEQVVRRPKEKKVKPDLEIRINNTLPVGLQLALVERAHEELDKLAKSIINKEVTNRG